MLIGVYIGTLHAPLHRGRLGTWAARRNERAPLESILLSARRRAERDFPFLWFRAPHPRVGNITGGSRPLAGRVGLLYIIEKWGQGVFFFNPFSILNLTREMVL